MAFDLFLPHRRDVLKAGLASAFALATTRPLMAEADREPILKVGIVTDIHHGDAPARGSRHYRDALPKLHVALQHFERENVKAILQLGDLVDGHESAEADEQAAREAARKFHDAGIPYHLLLGNHCLRMLSKRRFAKLTGARDSHYAFDIEGLHFIVLDPNFREDGTEYNEGNFLWTDCYIPPEQLDWLGQALAGSDKPTIILTHQRIDPAGNYAARNHEEVRKVIREAGGDRVKAVFQGHSHSNLREEIDGIPYFVLRAVIEGPGVEENNAYSILKLYDDGSLILEGFGEQQTHVIT